MGLLFEGNCLNACVSCLDTAYGFFVSCIHLVSQKLETSKSELSVSLAALELLAGLAKVIDSSICIFES